MSTIRPYTAADRESCFRIFDSNCPLYFDPTERDKLKHWLDHRDVQQIAHKNSAADHFYVLEHDNKVVACGGFYVLRDKPEVRLAWGMAHRDHHKKGLGKELLLYRFQEIEKLYPTHELCVDTSQHTSGFFEKLGFAITDITNDAYGPGLHRIDMVKISKR